MKKTRTFGPESLEHRYPLSVSCWRTVLPIETTNEFVTSPARPESKTLIATFASIASNGNGKFACQETQTIWSDCTIKFLKDTELRNVKVLGNAKIFVAEGVTVVIKGDEYRPAINVSGEGNELIVSGPGKLVAIGGYGAAGIGGNAGQDGSNITIVDTEVVARAGYRASAIGGGAGGSSYNIHLSDELKATDAKGNELSLDANEDASEKLSGLSSVNITKKGKTVFEVQQSGDMIVNSVQRDTQYPLYFEYVDPRSGKVRFEKFEWNASLGSYVLQIPKAKCPTGYSYNIYEGTLNGLQQILSGTITFAQSEKPEFTTSIRNGKLCFAYTKKVNLSDLYIKFKNDDFEIEGFCADLVATGDLDQDDNTLSIPLHKLNPFAQTEIEAMYKPISLVTNSSETDSDNEGVLALQSSLAHKSVNIIKSLFLNQRKRLWW